MHDGVLVQCGTDGASGGGKPDQLFGRLHPELAPAR
jgi:hypothetical protein